MPKHRKHIESLVPMLLLAACTTTVGLFLVFILLGIFIRGFPALSWEFITGFPRNGMTEGGILPAIAGTILLTLLTALISVPFGIACAVYLNEYAPDSLLTRFIRSAIRNLAGVPSIIFGLFGLALFVQGLHLGTSLLSAGLTLGLLSLPYIITTTEEALKAIPNATREGALALGATKYETIRDIILPAAVPGILTGVILALARAAGETAPILFTGAAFYITGLPGNLLQEFMAMPYHLYMLATQHQNIELVRPLAYGTAGLLITFVFLMNLTASYVRSRFRKKLHP
jgi:phosphate transport system permease protein